MLSVWLGCKTIQSESGTFRHGSHTRNPCETLLLYDLKSRPVSVEAPLGAASITSPIDDLLRLVRAIENRAVGAAPGAAPGETISKLAARTVNSMSATVCGGTRACR